MLIDPYDFKALRKQIELQRKHAFDLDKDINWHLKIDTAKMFLPLDAAAIAFPHASKEQRLALSQWLGLIVNATISEMEDALPKLREHGFERILRNYPVGPEIFTLGELFFAEELKHSQAFSRYLDIFCQQEGLALDLVKSLLPSAYGSFFQAAITKNATKGGHAFWWVVANVEEVSISIFHEIRKQKKLVDPLFYHLHKKHMEEEARHANFAYLMLDLIENSPNPIKQRVFRKTDFIFSQLVSMPWVLTELGKFYKIKDVAHKHPLFETLASCIPMVKEMSVMEQVERFFISAPYISWILNPGWGKRVHRKRKEYGALPVPFKKPVKSDLAG